MISIGEIVNRFPDSHNILISEEFKSLDSIINSEELPIVMLLTSMREELEAQNLKKPSSILSKELADLFQINASEEDLKWLIETHIKLLAKRRLNSNTKEVLIYCNKIVHILEIDHFFSSIMSRDVEFAKSSFLLNLDRYSETDLIEDLRASGISLD